MNLTSKKENFDEQVLQRALNAILTKEDLSILKVSKVDDSYHVRSTYERTYIYKIIQTEFPIPLLKDRVLFISPTVKINIQKIKESIEYFKGIHNFTAFSAFSKNGLNKSPIREILDIEFEEYNASEEIGNISMVKGYKLTVRGSSFMYHQIRIMVGYLLKVGVGKFSPSETKNFLESGERHLIINSSMVGPHGLYLANLKDQFQ
jgi:tRNA pseudouridine38-40 synthase